MTQRSLAVVCVDDEDVVLVALESQLGRALGDTFIIEMAESGEEAVELLEELEASGVEVALVISDHIMPGMRGDALLIEAARRKPDVLTILLTGQADLEAVGNVVHRGNLYRYIAKPWDKTDLELTVKEALRRYTQDKKLEAQNDLLKARNQELATINQAYQAKSAFLSGMAHELRTPLNGVLGYTQVLQADPALSADHLKSVGTIDRCGRHLLSLINEVLDLAKIESGHLDLEKGPVDLHRLLTESAHVLRPKARAKGVDLRCTVSEGVPAGLLTDGIKLRQVLFNLLGNAVKFTPEGEVVLRARVDGDDLVIEVSDTGVGMDAGELASLFQPFVQGEGGRTFGGTGLGLAISKSLIERLGGRLTVESAPGVGSTFRVVLSRDEVAIEAPLAEDTAHHRQRLAAGQRLDVLVVDDVATNRDVMVRFLENAGMTPIEAVNGEEAVAVIKQRRPSVVLMDLSMPVMDGRTACNIIREIPEVADTTVIGVSASITREIKVSSVENLFDDFITKPVQSAELLETIARHAQVTLEVPDESGAADSAQAPPGPEPAPVGDFAALLGDAAHIGDLAELERLTEASAAQRWLPQAQQEQLEALCEALDFEGLVQFAAQLGGALA